MNIFKRLFSKESEVRQVLAMQDIGRPQHSPREYRAFADEGYVKNVITYRCIELRSEAVSSIPLLLFKTRGNKEREELIDHPLLELLAKPNPLQGYQQFMKSIIGYLSISGNSFIEINKAGQLTELWPQRSDIWDIIPGNLGMPAAYVAKHNSRKRRFEVDQVTGRSQILHMKTFNPLNLWWGLSPIEAASYSVDQHNSMGEWNLALLQNGGRPSGALVVQATSKDTDGRAGRLDENQKQQLKKMMESYRGPKNSGKMLLLEGGLDWKEMGLSPKDMDWVKGKDSTSRDIANVFGVPSQMVGIPGAQTFANYEQARLAFYEDTILPLMNFVRDYLNMALVPTFGEGLELDYDLDAISALAPRRLIIWNNANTANWLTTNEKRELTGYGAYDPKSADAGDKILVNAGLIPLESAAEDVTIDDTTSHLDNNEPDIADFEDDENTGHEDEESSEHEDDEENGKVARWSYLEGKAFNLNTVSGRRNFWSRNQTLRRKFEKPFEAQMAAAFRKQEKELIEALEGVEPDLIEFVVADVITKTTPLFAKVMGSNINRIMRVFGKNTLDLAKHYPDQQETKDAQTIYNSFLQEFINDHVAKKVTNIQGNTRKKVVKQLRLEVAESLKLGETTPQLAKRVASTYDGFTKSRSFTIARTETHTSSQVATRQAAKALRLPDLSKEWIAAMDGRNRSFDNGDATDHTIMDGVKVKEGEKFEVPSITGIDLMDGPSDPRAPANQVINCRCVTAFVTERPRP